MRKIKKHTAQKLKYFEKYLNAYLTATKRLRNKTYLDAFAGTGKCLLVPDNIECDGSTLISLKAKSEFTQYIFIDSDKKSISSLRTSIDECNFPEKKTKKIKLITEDCNKFLLNFKLPGWFGCLALLDPEGSELRWKTVEALSKIKRIDLFILYAYDMSLVRLTKTEREKLDLFYGDQKWREIYDNSKNANEARIQLLEFYVLNLQKLNFPYVNYKPIRTDLRSGKLHYYFIFASRHPIAYKIMSQVFDKELDGQQKLLKLC